MMMVATVLLVTADRSRCWFTTGDDDAQADRLLAVGQGLMPSCKIAVLTRV